MRRTTIGKLKEYNMMLRLYGRYFNKFFKYNPDGEEVMDIIAKNIDQLSLDLYAIPTDMLYSKDGNYVGLLFDYLKGYKTIFDKLREHEEFDKDEVARCVLKTVNEFDAIGLDYYDIHDENFMISDNGDIKVIDIDGAEKIVPGTNKLYTINNLWDFLFEIYLFHFNPDFQYRLNRVWLFEEADTYFSNEFLEYIDGVIRDDRDVLTVSPSIYLPEFYDKEKIDEFSKRLELESRNYGR